MLLGVLITSKTCISSISQEIAYHPLETSISCFRASISSLLSQCIKSSGICCSGLICAVRSILCYQSFPAPRDADTAERYANIPFAKRKRVRSLGYEIKEKTPHKVVLKLCANRLQGYAARDRFLQFVPFCATKASMLLATQIPQSGMRTSLSQSEREFVPFGYDIKEKTPHKVVFFFLVHLQGFEPGTH